MKLNYDELLSNVAFNCKLRHYSMESLQTQLDTAVSKHRERDERVKVGRCAA